MNKVCHIVMVKLITILLQPPPWLAVECVQENTTMLTLIATIDYCFAIMRLLRPVRFGYHWAVVIDEHGLAHIWQALDAPAGY